MKYSEYGHFLPEDGEFIVTERKTPRHFYNYFFNDHFNSFFSQVGYGEGVIQDDMGRRVTLICDRALYIVDRESGRYHLATGLPMTEECPVFKCHHGHGYSTLICERNGIRTEYTVYVPLAGLCEKWLIKVTNMRDTSASLGVIAYAATGSDGPYTPQCYNKGVADIDPASGAIYIKNECKVFLPKENFAYHYMVSDGAPSAFDTRHNAFIGTYGTKEYPEALTFGGGCQNSDCVTEKCCFALERQVELLPGDSKWLAFEIGHTEKIPELEKISHSLTVDNTQTELLKVKEQRTSELSGVKISTPDEKLNHAFPFYQYANNMGSRWARVRHNGFRDIVQDTQSLASVTPELALERFKRILAYQSPDGYCPRTFIGGMIKSQNFSDNGVYLAGAAYDIVCELGRPELLREAIPFSDGSRADIFEHLRRQYEFLYNFRGINGLIKIWGGDWHDGMNAAGLEGKGVSIMLSMSFVRYNNLFVELARMLGEVEIAERHAAMSEELCEIIKKFGFTGEYYCTAINDEGKRIGAPESEGAKLFINPQIWAVLANIGSREEQLSLMNVVDEQLTSPIGTKFNTPNYTKYDAKVGSLTGQPAGTLINGAVYLQPHVWRIISECILGRADKVQEMIEKLLPWNHRHGVTYGEPYILYNFYHEAETGYRFGTPGQSWRTATHSIFVEAMIRYVFGLKPTLEGLAIRPCLPPDWVECGIEKVFRGCKYRIFYHQNAERSHIKLNGDDFDGDVLPVMSGEVRVDYYIGK